MTCKVIRPTLERVAAREANGRHRRNSGPMSESELRLYRMLGEKPRSAEALAERMQTTPAVIRVMMHRVRAKTGAAIKVDHGIGYWIRELRN